MNYYRIDSPHMGDYKSCTTNGEGFRVVLWTAGCSHHCPGCHNPETHDFLAGKPFTDETLEVLLNECDKPYISGLTLSGGDPVDNWDDVLQVVKAFRARFGASKDIWLWTGYTLKELEKQRADGLRNIDYSDIDVIVEGRFVLEKRNISLSWRGSENQRIFHNDNGHWTDITELMDKKSR